MDNTTKKSQNNMLGAIFFAALALVQSFYLLRSLTNFSYGITYVLSATTRYSIWIAIYGAIAYGLFIKNKKFILYGSAAYALAYVLELLETIINGYVSSLLFSLINTAGIVLFFLLVAAMTLNVSEETRTKMQNLWYLPTLVIGVRFVLSWIINIFRFSGGMRGMVISFLLSCCRLCGILCASAWVAYPNGVPKKQVVVGEEAEVENSYIYCNMAKHILLTIFTCGVWNMIWVFRVTNYLNSVEGEEYRNPTNKMLLCLFVPYYQIYWNYKSAQRIDQLATEKGMNSSISALCLVFSFFVPIVPLILMQDKLNAIATK